jgi:hypothetical protein
MIRPTKLGMKNWMFFGSLEAGTGVPPKVDPLLMRVVGGVSVC